MKSVGCLSEKKHMRRIRVKVRYLRRKNIRKCDAEGGEKNIIHSNICFSDTIYSIDKNEEYNTDFRLIRKNVTKRRNC